MEYSKAAAQVAAEASVASERSKKARSGGDKERAQPALRRCGNCGKTRHNARTCKKDTNISSKLDASTTYTGSLCNSDKTEYA
jgi:ribosomal protein L32